MTTLEFYSCYSVKKSWAPYSFFNLGVLKYFQKGIPNSSSGRTDSEVFAASIIFWASESGVIFGLRQPSLVSRATTPTAEKKTRKLITSNEFCFKVTTLSYILEPICTFHL